MIGFRRPSIDECDVSQSGVILVLSVGLKSQSSSQGFGLRLLRNILKALFGGFMPQILDVHHESICRTLLKDQLVG